MIHWEDPPPVRFRWKLAAEELKAQPGRWARVLEAGNKTESTNAWRALTEHGCEAAVRKVGSGFGVWARFPTTNPHVCRSTDPQGACG